jgi:hypothetical protein
VCVFARTRAHARRQPGAHAPRLRNSPRRGSAQGKVSKGSALTSQVGARACGGARLRDGTHVCACRRLSHDGGPEQRRTARRPKEPRNGTKQLHAHGGDSSGVGEYGLRKRPVTADADRQSRAKCRKWLSACNDDLMRMLTLLEACVCAVLQVLIRPRSFRSCRASVPKVQTGRETRLSESAPTPDGSGSCGVPRRPSIDAVAWWAVSVPKVQRARSEGHHYM